MKDEKKDSNGKGVKSPSDREQTIANSGGMPPQWSQEKVFSEAEPPDRMASDSTTDIGKP